MARRTELALPPVRAIAVLSGAGAGEHAVALRDVAGLTVTGPADGRYLVRGADAGTLADGLALVPRPAGVRVQVDPPRI